ncbi:MAG: type II secretion system protein N [Pseudomonadota bacterium]
MRRLIGLSLFAAMVFVIALVWTAPLSVVVDEAGLARRGISFERAQGTIWSGDLLGVRIGNQPVGQVSLELKPGAMLAGRLGYDMDVRGPAGQGRGDVAMPLGGGVTIRNMVADINLQAIERLEPRLRQVPATVSLTLPELVTDRAMGCRRVDGRLRTDLLEKLGTSLNWAGPAMAGVISCDGDGRYQLALANVGGEDEIALDAVASPQTASYTAEARVRTTNRRVADTLLLLKFQRDGDQFIYSRANGVVRSMGEAG